MISFIARWLQEQISQSKSLCDLDKRVFRHHIYNVPAAKAKSFEEWFEKYIGLDYKCERDGNVKHYYFYGMNGPEFEMLMSRGGEIL